MARLYIKPHHFVDIITGFGVGRMDPRPHPYGHAVHSVTKKIIANPGVELKMEFGADDICRPCCHNINGLCDDNIDVSDKPGAPESKREYNLLIDKRWSERLDVRPGDILTARELCLRIRNRARDISDIYRESPAEGTAGRQAKLEKGIKWFLER